VLLAPPEVERERYAGEANDPGERPGTSRPAREKRGHAEVDRPLREPPPEAILEQIEVIAYPHATDRSFNDRQLAAAREDIDERTWEEAWAEGRAMTTEEAVAYALEDQNPESSRSGVDEARKA
jgi:hypothetical protein